MGASHHGSEREPSSAEMEKLMRRFQEQVDGRAKRAYSEGRINKDDDGDLAFAIAADPVKRVVIIDFGKAVTWLGLPPKQANELANILLAKIRELGEVSEIRIGG